MGNLLNILKVFTTFASQNFQFQRGECWWRWWSTGRCWKIVQKLCSSSFYLLTFRCWIQTRNDQVHFPNRKFANTNNFNCKLLYENRIVHYETNNVSNLFDAHCRLPNKPSDYNNVELSKMWGFRDEKSSEWPLDILL